MNVAFAILDPWRRCNASFASFREPGSSWYLTCGWSGYGVERRYTKLDLGIPYMQITQRI